MLVLLTGRNVTKSFHWPAVSSVHAEKERERESHLDVQHRMVSSQYEVTADPHSPILTFVLKPEMRLWRFTQSKDENTCVKTEIGWIPLKIGGSCFDSSCRASHPDVQHRMTTIHLIHPASEKPKYVLVPLQSLLTHCSRLSQKWSCQLRQKQTKKNHWLRVSARSKSESPRLRTASHRCNLCRRDQFSTRLAKWGEAANGCGWSRTCREGIKPV